ncbi:MAG: sodium:solute symporter family protein [Calditrichaeota bacterium]|nr:MAG: sodium:solute symporter family protein [Calditrichota bacterium]
MQFIDYSIIIVYLALLLILGLAKRIRKDSTAADLIVGGRMLTLPAFVASLVSTWYGGILGVGEYSYNYGLSNWLAFGLPYYLAAFLFALFLAKKARKSEMLTIPDRLQQVYGTKAAVAGSVIIYLMTVPAAYILMLGTLAQFLFGWNLWVGILLGTLFSLVYVFTGGFNSVIRTDLFQFVLMFAGFAVLLIVLYLNYGGMPFLETNLPETHFTWHGGNSGLYIATWYVIALATLIEPSFYQRCYAAKTEKVARNGIFLSILCWAFFDFLTTSCGMYAKAILPDLENAVGSYPAVALEVLPAGLLGIFALSLLATVMSTVDSYSFVAATTFSKDIVQKAFNVKHQSITSLTRIGLLLTATLAIIPLMLFDSVVDIWYTFGSIGTPALLIPVFTSFVGKRKMSATAAFYSILSSGAVSLIWYLSQFASGDGSYWFSVQPIFPGLVLSLLIYLITSREK